MLVSTQAIYAVNERMNPPAETLGLMWQHLSAACQMAAACSINLMSVPSVPERSAKRETTY